MATFLPVDKFFKHIYLVDLSPSLCEVARKRFERLGWKNVTVLCQDARSFNLPEKDFDPRATNAASDGVDLITMSYSLSMIPGEYLQSHVRLFIDIDFFLDYYSVVDSLTSRLKSTGMLGVCDFYGKRYLKILYECHSFKYSPKHCGCVLSQLHWWRL